MAITISITAGSGYFGSTYTHTALDPGNWYSDENPISGATGSTYIMESVYQGTKITFRTISPAETSNAIKMWVPTDIGTPWGLWDASRADLITHASGRASDVASVVGSRHLTQATDAQRPDYSTTILNSLPGFVGDGTQKWFGVDAITGIPTGTTTHTAVTLANFVGSAVAFRTFMIWSSSVNYRALGKLATSDYITQSSGGSAVNSSAIAWSNAYKMIFAEATSARQKLNIDGGADIINANGVSGSNSTGFYIFRDSGATRWPGGFHELAIWAEAISNANRIVYEGYLAHKWGQTALLPGGHAYKTALPYATNVFSGSITFGSMTATGVLYLFPIFTGAVTFGDMIVTGVMRQRFVGDVAFSDMIVTGVMTQDFIGAIAFDSMVVTGELAQSFLGSITFDTMTAVGEMAFTAHFNVTGAISFDAMTVAGTLAMGGAFTGAATFGDMTVVGAMTFVPHYNVEGSIAFGDMTVAGVMSFFESSQFVGDITFGNMVATGTAIHFYFAEGSISFAEMFATGSMLFVDADVVPIVWEAMVVYGEMSFVEPDVIVEDGSVVPGANSYITVAYADYYLGKQGFVDWATTPLEEKIGALIRATLGIDSTYGSRYPGTKVGGRSQSLMWPRKDAEDNDEEEIADDEVPIEIRKATAEAAYLEWLTPGFLSPNWTLDQLVTQETLGPLSVSYSDPSNFGRGGNLPTLTKIDGILYPILGSSGPNLFGTSVRI